MFARLRHWLLVNRTSSRVAFALRLVSMAASVLLSLFWTRSLLFALGRENYGLFSTFAAFLGLAAAGDFGMGGAVAIRGSQLIASGKTEELRDFMEVARACFLTVAVTGAVVLLLLSLWLPGWLHFGQPVGRGSLPALFACGAGIFALTVYGSYLSNVAYAAGSIVWPVIPTFFVAQLTLILQVIFAANGAPLWLIQSSALLSGGLNLYLLSLMVRRSHPVFAERLAFHFRAGLLRELLKASFWTYLFGLAVVFNLSADRLVVNACFGAAMVPVFQLNGKLTEVAIAVLGTAAFVALPKIVHAMLSGQEAHLAAGKALAYKLARFQAFIAIAGSLAYLLLNDLFVRLLFGAQFLGEPALRFGFGAALLLMANSDIFLQLAARLGGAGLRLSAVAVVGCALVNIGLSLAAARLAHWLPGVVWATCFSQVLFLFIVSDHVRRRHHFSTRRSIVLRSLVLPLAVYGLACAGQLYFPPTHLPEFLVTLVAYFALLVGYSIVAGPTPESLWEEVLAGLHRFRLRTV